MADLLIQVTLIILSHYFYFTFFLVKSFRQLFTEVSLKAITGIRHLILSHLQQYVC